MKTPSDFRQCADRLRSLADPDRLRIVERLFAGPCCVTELARELGEEVAKISHHLSVLRQSAVVETDRQGRFIYYRLNPEVSFQKNRQGLHGIDLGCCRLSLRDDDPHSV